MRHVQTRAGHIGYRDQLDRARRFLERLEQPVDDMDDEGMTDVDFEDLVWAFFQNCWHVKDWVANDRNVPRPVRNGVIAMALASVPLKVCEQLCNGTKHLGRTRKKRRSKAPIAKHDHIDTTIVPGGPITRDRMIDNGSGKLISGRLLARQCIAEWDLILLANNLRAVSGGGATCRAMRAPLRERAGDITYGQPRVRGPGESGRDTRAPHRPAGDRPGLPVAWGVAQQLEGQWNSRAKIAALG